MQADQSHLFALINQTSQLSLDERWAHMQSCRKCCASAEISDNLLAGFIFIKFVATPLASLVYKSVLKEGYFYRKVFDAKGNNLFTFEKRDHSL